MERDSLTGEDAIVVSGNMRAFRDLARKYDRYGAGIQHESVAGPEAAGAGQRRTGASDREEIQGYDRR